MALISDGTIAVLRTLKKMGYSDRCTRLVRSVSSTTFSYGKSAYTEGKSFPCRFVPKPSPDMLPGADVQMTDAELFFDRGETLLADDHILITHIHGDKVTALEYEIVSGPVLTSLGQEATLKLFKG